MSWVLVAVIALLAVCGFIGWKKGIIKIVVSLLTIVATLLASLVIAPMAGAVIRKTTDWDDKFEKAVYTAVMNNEQIASVIEDKLGSDVKVSFEGISETTDDLTKYTQQLSANLSVITQYTGALLEKLNLPDNISEQIEKIASADGLKKLTSDNTLVTVAKLSNGSISSIVVAMIAVKLSGIIFNAIVYVAVFAIVFVLLRVLVIITGVLSKLPVIKQANEIGGLALGIVEGLLLVWLMFIIITACGNSSWASVALADIADNKLLSFLYDSNLILKLVFKQ